MSRPTLPTDLIALPQIATSKHSEPALRHHFSCPQVGDSAPHFSTLRPDEPQKSCPLYPPMLIVSPKAEIARPFFDNLVYVAAGNLYLRKSDDPPIWSSVTCARGNIVEVAEQRCQSRTTTACASTIALHIICSLLSTPRANFAPFEAP